jgi:deoxyribose-phosphate aldolase
MKVEFQCTDETLSNQEIGLLIDQINQYSFIKKVSCLPPYIGVLKKKIENTKIASIIDFPLGLLKTEQRLDSIKDSIQNGATSIEVVMPSFLINNKQTSKIKTDIEKCYNLCVDNNADLHYILEYRSYNYSCLYRLIKNLIKFNLNEVYISTGYRLDDIYDHLIAMAFISKEISEAKIICNANIYNDKHLELLKSNNIDIFRIKHINALDIISQKYYLK